MKKLSGIVVFFLLTIKMFSNPIDPFEIHFSELKFENDSTWIIEIFIKAPPAQSEVDSICISSLYGCSRILNYIGDSSFIIVVTKDSLHLPLEINRYGDYISLISYKDNSNLTYDWIPFGNVAGSKFPGLLPLDYSICKISVPILPSDVYYYYSRDKSPTIGLPNDTIGTNGVLKGLMTDKNYTLVRSGDFSVDYPIPVNLDTSGNYSTLTHSSDFLLTYIFKRSGMFYNEILNIDSLHFDIYPDSVYEYDIHFKDYIVGVNEKSNPENFEVEILNYPNPFNSTTNFYINIPNDMHYENGEINIFNINGEKIFTILIPDNSTAVWNGVNMNGEEAASGIYYYQLSFDNKVYNNGSMILLK